MKNYFVLIFLVGVMGGCTDYRYTEDSQGNLQVTQSPTAPPSVSPPSGASCDLLGYFSSLDSCRSATYSQCNATSAIINGRASTCYMPATGWQSCASNPPSWDPKPWKFCLTSKSGNTYNIKKVRTVRCNGGTGACSCVGTAPATSENCTIIRQGMRFTTNTCDYSFTSATLAGIPDCSSGELSDGTVTPAPTPAAKCSNVLITYDCTDCSWAQNEFINFEHATLVQHFQRKGYQGNPYPQIMSDELSSGGGYWPSHLPRISDNDKKQSYVIRVGIKNTSNGCSRSRAKNGTYSVEVFRNGNSFSRGTSSESSCKSRSDVGRILRNIPIGDCTNN